MTFLINYQKPRINSVWNDFFSEGFVDRFYASFDTTIESIPLQVKDGDTSVNIAAKLAGFNRDEIEISVEKGYLTITAQSDKKEDAYSLNEFGSSSLKRTVYIGEVQDTKAEASLKEGVLHISFPKAIKDTKKTISIS